MLPVIKWSGSKRSQAETIKSLIPPFARYFEPFCGGCSVFGAVSPLRSVCGDICEPLINLWKEIRDNPEEVSCQYRQRWERLKESGSSEYYRIREIFNKTKCVYDFLFLSRTCVNGLIRFNSKGEFNSPFHITRDGIKPETLHKIILEWSEKVKDTDFRCGNYAETTQDVTPDDVVYLDPPYFNTKGMYYGKIEFEEFLGYLESLNTKGIRWLLSYDGIRGKQDNTVEIPKELFRKHLYIQSGKSGLSRVLNSKDVFVQESLYTNF